MSGADVRRQADRDDGLVIWTVDLLAPLGRTIDVEAADEADARAKAIESLTAEED